MSIIKISQNGQALPDVKLTNNQGDTAFTLPIKNIYEGCGFILTFSNFETDGVTPKNWPTATYSLAISPDQGGDRTIMLIAPTVTGNLITIGVNDSQNILKAGIKYHWDLLAKPEVGDSWVQAKGVIEAMQTRSRKLTVTNVSVTGQQVVVLTDYFTKEETYSREQIDQKFADIGLGGGTGGGTDHTHSNKAILDAITAAFTTEEKNKLSGIATGATANDTDANLKNRTNHTGTQSSATISDFQEAVQDAVAALLGAGSNVILNYDDASNSLTISSTGEGGTGLDAEAVRDAIGVALVGVGNIAVTVNDAADTITITTTATQNSTDAQLRDRSTHTGTQSADTLTDGTDNKIFTAAEKTKLGNISGTNTGDETGAGIKTKLEALTGDNRVDASAIKNLPTGGGSAPTLAQMILAGEHFNHFNRIGDFDTISSGAGAFTNAFIAGKEGVGQLSSGNTATSRLAIMRSAGAVKNHQMSGVARVYQTSIMIPTLSNTTDEYVVIAGWHDNNNGSTPTSNQLAFVYDRAATGDFWTTKAKVNGGATASVTTGIAVVAGQWYTLKIELNRDGTEAKFYIDGALIDTKTTAFSTSNATYLILGIFKSVGTTARLVNSDYWYEKFDMNLS